MESCELVVGFEEKGWEERWCVVVGVPADRWDQCCFVRGEERVEVSIGSFQCLEIFGVVRDMGNDLEHQLWR